MKRVLILLIFISTIVLGVKFEEKIDVKYLETINYLVEKEIIKGFPDGTFKVNWAITEAEFLTMVVRCNLKYKKNYTKTNFFDFLKNFFYSTFKRKRETKFSNFENYWFHPYLIEYLNMTNIKEEEIEPLLYINIYDALYFLIKTKDFKNEIEGVDLPLDEREKREVLICAVSHKIYVNGLPFRDKLSRGDAFILIENYLRKVGDDFNN